MRRREFITALGVAIWPVKGRAEQARKIARMAIWHLRWALMLLANKHQRDAATAWLGGGPEPGNRNPVHWRATGHGYVAG
jgi:hypothetical protein